MVDTSRFPNSLADRTSKMFCMDPDLPDDVRVRGKVALHQCKEEVAEALLRLYAVVPQPQADALLAQKLKPIL